MLRKITDAIGITKRTTFTTNKVAAPKLARATRPTSIKLNLGGAQIRHATLEGKPYMVVPAVILTVGVHNGSEGPLLYPEDELAKVPEVWDHKPVVVYHPTINGKGVSACSPEILETSKIGLMLNTKATTFVDPKGAKSIKLNTEAWLDRDRVEKVDARILEKLEKGETVELSTGLFTDNEEVSGEWNGEKFTAIARNYRPDHLAILPDQTGSCSIKDGAGLLRNVSHDELRGQLQAALDKKHGRDSGKYVQDVYDGGMVHSAGYGSGGGSMHQAFKKTKSGGVELQGEPKPVSRKVAYHDEDGNVVANDALVGRADEINSSSESPLALPATVDEVAERERTFGAAAASQIKRVDETPKRKPGVDVLRSPETGTGQPQNKGAAGSVPGAVSNHTEAGMLTSKVLTAILVANSAVFEESDRPWLEAQTPERLTAFCKNEALVVEPNSEEELANAGDKTGLEPPTDATGGKKKTPVKKTPAGVAEGTGVTTQGARISNAEIDARIANDPRIQRLVRMESQEKARLIKAITSNARCVFKAEDLVKRDLDELNALARLATNETPSLAPVANFSGLGDAYGAETTTAEEPLELPKYEFGPAAK